MTAPQSDADSIFLVENQQSDPFELSTAERDALTELVRGMGLAAVPGHDHLYQAKPRNIAGAIQLGNRRVFIAPKLPIRRLLFLLSYSMDPSHWRQLGFDFQEEQDLFEAVVPGFAFQVEEALRQGPLFGYQTREEGLQTVRGRIHFHELLRARLGIVPPVDCVFDEFTEDIEINRQIRAAVERLGRIKIRSEHTRRRLRILRSRFTTVSSVTYDPRKLPELHFNRLNGRFRRPAEFARLILRSRSLDIRVGAVSGAAVLFDLSEIFEDFVVTALRESLGLSPTTFPQEARGHTFRLDEGGSLALKPDLSWWVRGRCVFVGDVKYKKTPETSGVRHPDIYQLLAYATAADLRRGLLVYAAGEAESRSYAIRGADKQLEVRTLDLDRPPEHVLEQIDHLAGTIRTIRFSADSAARRIGDPAG